jgi:polyhydroxyalkanoate synthase
MALLSQLALASLQAGHRQLREVTGLDYSLIDYQGAFAAGGQFALAWWLAPPFRAFEAQAELVARFLSLFEHRPEQGLGALRSGVDKRFLDGAWSADPVLAVTKELYLLHAEWVMAQIRNCEALSDHDKQKLAFYTRQLLSALAPTNLALINPKIGAEALRTIGESLVNGLENMLHDVEHGVGCSRSRRPIPTHSRSAAISLLRPARSSTVTISWN